MMYMLMLELGSAIYAVAESGADSSMAVSYMSRNYMGRPVESCFYR